MTTELSLAEIYRKLAVAEKQIEDGDPLLDGEEVLKKLREMYGS